MQPKRCRRFSKKTCFWYTAVRLHPSAHQQMADTHLSSALHTEQKHQMYTSIQPYILFGLTAFQQLFGPMQMRLSPTPHRGKVIWTAEYKWLGMIDRPSHSPPSTDRNSDRHMHPSHSFLAFLSCSIFLSHPLTC